MRRGARVGSVGWATEVARDPPAHAIPSTPTASATLESMRGWTVSRGRWSYSRPGWRTILG